MQQTTNLAVATNSAKGRADLDYALARQAARGATNSIGDLYERHSKRVYAQCLRMTGNPEEAEDLTHEVFVQLLQKIGSFRGKSQFTTWLYRLTVNQVLMHFRQAKYLKTEMQIEPAIESYVSSLPSTGAVILERIVLDRALARLPTGCRSVLLLFDVAGYNHGEIAHICGFSVGNSKSQLHKARKKLRKLLRPNCELKRRCLKSRNSTNAEVCVKNRVVVV